MAKLPRRGLSSREQDELVSILVHAHGQITQYRLRMPLKSPSYAALGVLQTQIGEIVGYVTGDHARFHGKPHSMKY